MGWSTSIPGLSSAYQNAAKFPVGKSVTVYYAPKHPRWNALSPGNKWDSLLLIGIGFLTISIATLVLVT